MIKVTRIIAKTYDIYSATDFQETIVDCKKEQEMIYKKKDPLLEKCFACGKPFVDSDVPFLGLIKKSKNVYLCRECGEKAKSHTLFEVKVGVDNE